MPDPFDAREAIEANIVSGDIDDDVAVFTVAGLIGDFATLRARLASCEAEREKAIELIDEGLGILVSLIDNVTRRGNYSPESTCTFIDQAGWSFRAARAALTKGGEDAE